MTKLEEVARAICCNGKPCEVLGTGYDPVSGNVSRCQSHTFLRDARNAVEALRNRNDFMMDAAEDKCGDEHRWVAIIDAILNETPEGKD